MRRSCPRHRGTWSTLPIWCLGRFHSRRMIMLREGLRRPGKTIHLHLWFGMISVEKSSYKNVSFPFPKVYGMIDDSFSHVGCSLALPLYLLDIPQYTMALPFRPLLLNKFKLCLVQFLNLFQSFDRSVVGLVAARDGSHIKPIAKCESPPLFGLVKEGHIQNKRPHRRWKLNWAGMPWNPCFSFLHRTKAEAQAGFNCFQ